MVDQCSLCGVKSCRCPPAMRPTNSHSSLKNHPLRVSAMMGAKPPTSEATGTAVAIHCAPPGQRWDGRGGRGSSTDETLRVAVPAGWSEVIAWSDSTRRHGVLDPGDDFVEHGVEWRGGLETQHPPGFLRRGHAALHVVLEGVVGRIAEWHVRALDLAPDQLGELEHNGRLRGGEIEVVVECLGMLHRRDDALGQVVTVGVVTDLAARSKDVQGILALEH